MLEPIRTDARSPTRKGAGAHASGRLRQEQCAAPKRAHRRGQHLRLDRQATEAITHFAWLLARCGYSREQSARLFRAVGRAIPERVGSQGVGARCGDDAAQVITLWYMTSEYLDGRGKPLALPLMGPSPSIEALIREVNPELTVPGAMEYLNAARSLKRRGQLYLPRSRAVALRHDSPFQNAYHLRVVSGLLRTVDFNSRSPRQRFQYLADGWIPAGKLGSVIRDFRPTGFEMLKYADAYLLRRAAGKGKGKPIPLSVGVFVFEGCHSPTEALKKEHEVMGRKRQPKFTRRGRAVNQ
jgi:hypothetical protein